jgi:hypothetical protein
MPNSTSCGRTKSTLFSSKLNENFFEILNSKFIPGEGRRKHCYTVPSYTGINYKRKRIQR